MTKDKEGNDVEVENRHDIPTVDVPKNWPQKGTINFKDVDLRYRPNLEKVLIGLTFEMQGGHKVGIVGRTGCGKSTTCLALSRILEIESGCMQVDGVDISKVNLHLLRDKITVIPQEPVIFDGTIKFNLDPSGETSDQEIERVLRAAGLEALLERTPEKPHVADD